MKKIIIPLFISLLSAYSPSALSENTNNKQLGTQAEITKLKEKLSHKSKEVRKNTAKALGRINWKDPVDSKLTAEVIQSLQAALKDQDPWVRSAVVWALGRIGRHKDLDASTIQAMGAVLKDTEYLVQFASVTAFGKLRIPQTVDSPTIQNLAAILTDKGDSLQLAAIIALTNIARHQVLNSKIEEDLQRLAKEDKDFLIKKTAQKALKVIKLKKR